MMIINVRDMSYVMEILTHEKVNNPKILFQLKTNGEIMFSDTCPTWIKKLFT